MKSQKASSLLADKWRYLPLRLLSERNLRRWFLKRCGQETGQFSFSRDLSANPKRLFFLPTRLETLSVHLPLLIDLAATASKGDLTLLCDESFHPLLKSIGLESVCLFAHFQRLRFGEVTFAALENQLRAASFEVCTMLEPKENLLQLYLARATGATWRIGFEAEQDYPFLNISLRSSLLGSPYAFRKILREVFKLPALSQPHPLVHNPEQLSSRHVILLNLEPSINGTGWTTNELAELTKHLDPHYRLLALVPDASLLEPHTQTLEKLAIRVAPIAGSYHAFLDLLRQYHGMVSLNSPHAQLAMNVSRIPTLLLNEPTLAGLVPPDLSDVVQLERGKPFPPNPLAFLTR